jgi:hypothetical protein
MKPTQPTPPDDPLFEPANAALAARARAELDASVAALDAATLSRLNRARQGALDAARATRHASWRWPGLAAGAFAAVVAVALWQVPRPAVAPDVVAPLADDLALVADGSDLELVEDLEFYAWLDAQSVDG